MRLNRSQWLALVIAVGLAGWLGSGRYGALVGLPEANGKVNEPPKPEVVEAPKAKPLQRVQVRRLHAERVTREVVIHGYTAPARSVTLSAETDGRVVAVEAERGADLEAGALVVRLDMRTRRDALSRAEALLRQRELEYRAAKKLHKQNLRAETQLAEALTALEAAQADLRAIQLDIKHVEIHAPFAGRLERRMVEVGDYLGAGDPVAEMVELSPLIVTGQATEQEVGLLKRGLIGQARLVTGQSAEGELRYVAAIADADTRTFTVELELANRDHHLAAGVTAVIALEVEALTAHYVTAALLSLSDEGALGVKTVDPEGVVRFHPAEVVRSDSGGVWLGGLPEEVRLITVGQGFVRAGQTVEASEEGSEKGVEEGGVESPKDEGAQAPASVTSLGYTGNPRGIS